MRRGSVQTNDRVRVMSVIPPIAAQIGIGARPGRHGFNFGISEITLPIRPKSVIYASRPASSEGRFAIVTDVRRDAVDAEGARDVGA